MTRIDFHFNLVDRLDYGCRLARKIVRAGERAVFWCPDHSLLAQWDTLLWTFSNTDFVPHVRIDDKIAAQTPIVFSAEAPEQPDRAILVSLAAQSEQPTVHFSRFERLIELVSTDPADRALARARWRFYRERGYPIHTHEVATPRSAT